MKKSVTRSKTDSKQKKVFNNRLLYSLISLGILILAAATVYGYTVTGAGSVPNPGHPISELQACSTSGDVIQVDSAGHWACTSLSSQVGGGWTVSGTQVYYNGGNVGIGTNNPQALLDISGASGDIQLGNPGDMTFNGGSNGIFVFKNTNTNGAIDFYIGSSQIVRINKSGAYSTAYFYSSDKRLKMNITDLSGAQSLNNIQKLQGVSFNWKSTGEPDLGLIAQDVQKVYPSLVSAGGINDTLAVNYAGLIAPMIETIKYQQQEINGLKQQVIDLQNKI